MCARAEKAKQETNEAHSLHRQIPAERCLKFRNCFLHSVRSANFSPKVIRCSEWLRRTNKTPHRTSVNLDESLARGHDSPWTTWRCLNRLRTGYTCSKEQQKKWQYLNGDTMHPPCILDDLSKFNDTAKSCVERCKTTV